MSRFGVLKGKFGCGTGRGGFDLGGYIPMGRIRVLARCTGMCGDMGRTVDGQPGAHDCGDAGLCTAGSWSCLYST